MKTITKELAEGLIEYLKTHAYSQWDTQWWLLEDDDKPNSWIP